MNMNKTIFISGKVTGEDYQKAWNKFQVVEELLTEFGFNVVNPLRVVPRGTDWQTAMDMLDPHLRNSDTVVFLEDWKNSFGARTERKNAELYGKEIVDYGDIFNDTYIPRGHATQD